MAFSSRDQNNGPLRLVYLCNEYPPARHGGIGTFTQIIGRALANRGHLVDVLGFYPTACLVQEEDQGVRVTRIPRSRIRGLGILSSAGRLQQAITKIARDSPTDIIEGQENAFAFLPRHLPGRRVLRMHGGHHFFSTCLGERPRAWRSWLERRSFARADYLCGVSRFVAEETRRLLRLGSVPIEILPNPVDTKKFRPMPEVSIVPGLIVFVGTLCEKKGIRQLVLGMPEIIAAMPNVRLVVYGRDTTDPGTGRSYREGLEAAVPAPVRQRITFQDHVDNAKLPAALAAAGVLVYPSHMESQGIVVIEGMAMGKPVVASKTGPGPEIIEDGVSGLLCDPHDPHSIAQAVIRLLKDRDLASRLGLAARQRALREFSLDKLVGRNVEFYRRCLKMRPHE